MVLQSSSRLRPAIGLFKPASYTPRMPDMTRETYPDALRALALIVVVFGHWIATRPRLDEGVARRLQTSGQVGR